MGFKRIILEGDSLTIIKKLLFEKDDRSMIHSIMQNIRMMAKFLKEVSYTFIPRRGNKVAHCLAIEGRRWSTPCCWVEEVLVPVDNLVVEDWADWLRDHGSDGIQGGFNWVSSFVFYGDGSRLLSFGLLNFGCCFLCASGFPVSGLPFSLLEPIDFYALCIIFIYPNKFYITATSVDIRTLASYYYQMTSKQIAAHSDGAEIHHCTALCKQKAKELLDEFS
ncbi:hypothetical protein J1N35_031228 [Gossypium stocksii]|uniref:RNase H type-1 domain-containing protein n=1 Tax=Gossypium stocksii TaxID=47602 RepID=A0A9D3V146_9ROSI|nr:hypothetical protein J1N35_031228 [Gossypium stocksii]